MLRNYLLTAWRALNKNKGFSFINIFGLAIGMAVCLLILQYVNFELGFDQFNKNIGEIYRVANDRYQNGKLIQHGTITYSGIGKALQDDYPEVLDHIRVVNEGRMIISYQDKRVGERRGMAIDDHFFSMFSYPLLAGDPATALKEPRSVVISQSSALSVFGDVKGDYTRLIGKQFILDRDSTPYKVSGVMPDMPENSHLQFDLLISYSTLLSGKDAYKEADYDFTDSDFWHYIQLRPGADVHALEAKLDAFSERHFHGTKVSGTVEKFHLQPLAKAHLYSDYEYEIGKTGSATVVWGLFIIAVFIIAIAWVNYINLSTARSVERAKEVGVRKVTGATRGGLIRQFLVESLLVNLIAFGLAIGLMFLAQHAFNRLIQTELSFSNLFQQGLHGYSITIGLGILLLLGIFVSAFYPAFVLSSFQPIAVLKGKFRASKNGIVLRKGLVIGQFAITILLISGSVIVYKQITYMSSQELGMNIDHMLIVKPPVLTGWDSTFIGKENDFKNELKQIPGVTGTATAARLPGNEMSRVFNVRRLDDPHHAKYTMRWMGVDHDYTGLYNIRIIAGRDFDAADHNPDASKIHNILLSEQAIRLMGFTSPEQAVGKQITMMAERSKWDIVGVFKDFHQKSLRYALEPTLLMPLYGTNNWISVKVNTNNVATTMAAVRNKYNAFFPGNPFDYFFLDERFNAQYKNDQLFGKAFTLFAGLAIFIACLGLLGLSAFGTAQRIKEIGIRKVLGASVTNIVVLLSRDFILLIAVAFLIAGPVAWFIMHRWLDNFAYRISLSPWVFLGAGLLAIFIALLTISFQSIKAAMTTPVKSLRTE
ncbi:MAG TPA: ABC transporter permease [Puia sp.]|nr:ABC transporter permease [Puia sp.]